MHPPIRLAIIVASITFQPPIHAIQSARIGLESCHRHKYNKNLFIFSPSLLLFSIIYFGLCKTYLGTT